MTQRRKSPIFYDDEVIGFGLQVRHNGRKTFTLDYTFEGRRRPYSVGFRPNPRLNEAEQTGVNGYFRHLSAEKQPVRFRPISAVETDRRYVREGSEPDVARLPPVGSAL